MRNLEKSKMLRLHFSEGDIHEGKFLYEAIVEECKESGLAGATVFRGLEGFGESAELHRAHLGSHDQPIVLVIIDSEEKIRPLLPVLEQMIPTGLITMSDVEVRRINKTAGPK